MTAITLPTSPRPSAAAPSLRSFGVDLTPPLGGPVQRASRLGSRFVVDVTYPIMTKAQFDPLLAALMNAEAQGLPVVLELPQDTAPSGLGSPLVNGASQTGTTLNADAFTNSVAIPVGAFFSFTAGGRNNLHMIRAAVSANGSGVAALPIAPMLRASPADNAALNFATPKVEGFVEGEIKWSVDTAKRYSLSFSVAEAA